MLRAAGGQRGAPGRRLRHLEILLRPPLSITTLNTSPFSVLFDKGKVN
jgi:hypothetical protein